jgi:hypothetical protein
LSKRLFLPLTWGTVNPGTFLPLTGGTVNPGTFLPITRGTVDPGAFLPSPFLSLPVSIDDLTFLQITVNPLMQLPLPLLQFTFNPKLFLPAALVSRLILHAMIPVNDATPIVKPTPLPIQHSPLGETSDTAAEITAMLWMLIKFPGGVLVTISDTPSVNRSMQPPSGLCKPAVVPDVSGAIVDIDVNIVTGPVEITPGTPGKTERDTGPI